MEHGEVEELILHEGMELLRRLLQGHLDLRAAKETKRETLFGASVAGREAQPQAHGDGGGGLQRMFRERSLSA